MKNVFQNNVSLYRTILCTCITILLFAACDTPGGDNGGGNGNGNGMGTENRVDFSISIADVPRASVVEGGTITLSAQASATQADSAVQITGYEWSLVTPQEGLAGVEILRPNAAETEVNLPFLSTISVGQSLNLGFQVTVTAAGQTAMQTQTVSLNNDPFSATVNITPSQTSSVQSPLAEASTLMLNANGSTTSGGTPSYLWEHVNPSTGVAPAQFGNPNAATTSLTLPYSEAESGTVTIRLTIFEGTVRETSETTIHIEQGNIDSDGDGLIDIRGLTMLHNMRYSLDGRSYKTSATDGGAASNSGLTSGCPASGCFGYELVSDLDFDLNGNGTTWSETGTNTFTLDSDDVQTPYFTIAQNGSGGWEPIGTATNNFSAVFNGNGYTIHNLAIIQPSTTSIGIFNNSTAPGYIANTHLRNALIVGNGAAAPLVGTSNTSLTTSSSSGRVVANGAAVSGLIGNKDVRENTSYIVANYSASDIVSNSASGNSNAGGIIGQVVETTFIQANYSTGNITASLRNIGTIVGESVSFPSVNITANYSTGNISGSNLVGNILGFIAIGLEANTTVRQSFGFGTATSTLSTGTVSTLATPNPSGVTSPADLTLALANGENSSVWNSADHNTAGAWDFTRRAVNGGPSLMYADYDGPTTATGGSRFYCEGETEPSFTAGTDPRPIRIANCGEHLPHQFAREN